MKTQPLILAVVFGLLFTSCTTDEAEEPSKGQISFLFELPGEVRSSVENASMLLTIQNARTSLEQNIEVRVLPSAGGYATQAVSLYTGEYVVKNYKLVGESFEVPANRPSGSKELNFHVSANMLTTAELPGLALLDKKVVQDDSRNRIALPFLICVSDQKNGKLKFTHATVSLEKNGQVVAQWKLVPNINRISFSLDPVTVYTLKLSKDGTTYHTFEFSYEWYRNLFGSQPLHLIINTGASTFRPVAQPDLYLTTVRSGLLTFQWPDGAMDILRFQPVPTDRDKLSFHHVTHHITGTMGEVMIGGDLDKIVEFITVSTMSSINVSNLVNLENLTMENSSLQVLDLRGNLKLTTLALVNTDVESIRFGEKHSISLVQLEGTSDTPLRVPTDQIIGEVYRNAVTYNIREGSFILFHCGNISPASVEKLNILENAYSWYVEIE